MVRIPDEQSFTSLTLAELLHPESADSGITRRYGDESPWATVYHETVAGPFGYENITVATNVEVVSIDDDAETANPQQPQDRYSPPGMSSSTPHPSHCEPITSNQPYQQPLPKVQPWRHSNLLDLILGFAFSLAAFLCTIKIELTAIIIYTIAAGCHYLADEVFQHAAGTLGRSICMLVCWVLMVVDPILLTVSLVVTELIGGLALMICSISGGPKSGQRWHQFIRKTCHLTRWGFRSCHTGWKPERIFPVSLETERSHLVCDSTRDPVRDEPYSDNDPEEEASYYYPQQPEDGGGALVTQMVAQRPLNVYTLSSNDHESSTMFSDLTFHPNDGDYQERPTIAIAPENVTVVLVEETASEDHERSSVSKRNGFVVV